jgi:hypothetical protein
MGQVAILNTLPKSEEFIRQADAVVILALVQEEPYGQLLPVNIVEGVDDVVKETLKYSAVSTGPEW